MSTKRVKYFCINKFTNWKKKLKRCQVFLLQILFYFTTMYFSSILCQNRQRNDLLQSWILKKYWHCHAINVPNNSRTKGISQFTCESSLTNSECRKEFVRQFCLRGSLMHSAPTVKSQFKQGKFRNSQRNERQSDTEQTSPNQRTFLSKSRLEPQNQALIGCWRQKIARDNDFIFLPARKPWLEDRMSTAWDPENIDRKRNRTWSCHWWSLFFAWETMTWSSSSSAHLKNASKKPV